MKIVVFIEVNVILMRTSDFEKSLVLGLGGPVRTTGHGHFHKPDIIDIFSFEQLDFKMSLLNLLFLDKLLGS